MSKRDKYKLLGLLITAVAGFISCGLAIALLEVAPLALLIILMLLFVSQIFFLVLALYSTHFWRSPPKDFRTIFSWFVVALMIIFAILTNVWVLPEGIRALWLQHFGEVTEAIIIDRQVVTSQWRRRTYEYHQIIYQWEMPENGITVKQYTGETSTPLSWAPHTAPGTHITIRYLPDNPTISRVEEDFVGSPVNEVGFSLFINLYVILATLVYFWVEKPRLNYVEQTSYSQRKANFST
jgi:hypothetical protein